MAWSIQTVTAGEGHPPTQTSMVTRISRKPPSQECHLEIYGYRYPSLLMQLVIGILYRALMNFLFGFGGNGTHRTSKLGQKQDRKHFKIQLKIHFIFINFFTWQMNSSLRSSKQSPSSSDSPPSSPQNVPSGPLNSPPNSPPNSPQNSPPNRPPNNPEQYAGYLEKTQSSKKYNKINTLKKIIKKL